MGELGSEFMNNSYKKGKNEYLSLSSYPKRYVLSGRTGLYLIAEELRNVGVSSVALPAYCCASMVAPFIEAKFNVSFYEANSVPINGAVLIMDYFGFVSDKTAKYAKKCKASGLKVIVDATQTAFSKAESYDKADFIVVSYRKWLDCLCAVVYSRDGFTTTEYGKDAVEYTEIWREAAKKKREYIDTGYGDKQDFLNMYFKANTMLAKDYIGYRATWEEVERFESVDSQFIRNRRKRNASILMSALIGKLGLMFEEFHDKDCPLHVPVILPIEKRAELKKQLVLKEIYCPCHWPINQVYPYKKTCLHDEEISLICDQRYTEEDMIREADEILRILERKEVI